MQPKTTAPGAEKVTVADNEVTMTVSTKLPEGEEIEVTFNGTLDGDTVEGDVAGELIEFEFTGKRVDE